MRAIGEGAEKKVRERVARDMLGIGLLLRQDQSFRRNAALRGKRLQSRIGVGIAAQKPEDGSWNLIEDRHPGLENLRRDFLHAVEAAKNEAMIRQPLV